MRAASNHDFVIELPGVGEFTFAKRTMGDMIKIRSQYLKLIKDDDGDDELVFFCGFVAAYKELIVSCPVGWEDASALDFNAVGVGKIIDLANLLTEKESSFRRVSEV
jgi:hypothetical protein